MVLQKIKNMEAGIKISLILSFAEKAANVANNLEENHRD